MTGAGARDRLFNQVRLGIRAERCIAAFSDRNQSTQRPKDYNMWANRGHPCFYKNVGNGAFSDILHTNPHLVGRINPVSVEVASSIGNKGGRERLSFLGPRPFTIRLSTPKTTTGGNLILGYTSPLMSLLHLSLERFTKLSGRTHHEGDTLRKPNVNGCNGVC